MELSLLKFCLSRVGCIINHVISYKFPLFPPQETGRESISTSDQAHSSASKEDGRTSEDGHGTASETDNIKDDAYEEAFGRMKKAAGVSDVDEVVRRFETQEETANHLQELQARAEKEIRD